MRGSLSLALTAPASATFAAGHPEYGLGTTPRQVTTRFTGSWSAWRRNRSRRGGTAS